MTRPCVDPLSDAVHLLQQLRERTLSAVELLDLYLDRIRRFNPILNAVVIPNNEGAREAAREADRRRQAGDRAPLLGLPLTVKDCIDVAGLRGTAGVEEFAERRPLQDARNVTRLKSAGAVLLGKTNVSPWASDWQARNPLFGRTNNPWNLGRSPGGSTGGGAAAVAAGLTALEIGSDSAGSIRVPAAFCGIYGHKPSETAVPRSGHFPGEPLPNAGRIMEVQGPLARSARDLELVLDVIAGPDTGEDAAWRLEIPPARAERLRDFRVAVLPPIPWAPLDSEIEDALETVAGKLVTAGARVDHAQPDQFGDLVDHHLLYSALLGAMTASNQTDEECRLRATQESDDRFEVAYCRAFCATVGELLRWHVRREEYRESYRRFFREWDLLIAPCNVTPAFPHNDEAQAARTLSINGSPVEYYLQMVHSGLASLSGQPATVFPAGVTRSGLPIGLQAIGPYLEDRTPIRFAALLADEIGGFRPPSGYDEGDGLAGRGDDALSGAGRQHQY